MRAVLSGGGGDAETVGGHEFVELAAVKLSYCRLRPRSLVSCVDGPEMLKC